MPIYEYRCERGHLFEVIQGMTDDPVTACEECGAPVERVFHPVAVHFKGSGFYNTDYKGKGKGGQAGEGGESGSSEGKSDSSSDSGSSSDSDSGSSSDSDSGSSAKKSDSSGSDSSSATKAASDS